VTKRVFDVVPGRFPGGSRTVPYGSRTVQDPVVDPVVDSVVGPVVALVVDPVASQT